MHMNTADTAKTSVELNELEPVRLLVTELEKAHRDELRRIQIQHLEMVRQSESARLQAENERDALEDRFFELEERYRNELARLHTEISQTKEEALNAHKSLSALEKKLLLAEGLRDNLDQERRGLLERLRAEEKRGAEERKRLEEENKVLLERIDQLNEMVSAAAEKRQGLEIARAELAERVAALEGLRDKLDQERRELLERLRAEEKRGAEERKKLEEERDFYRQAMISAEQQLDIVSKGFLHQVGTRLGLGWKGVIGLPATILAALRAMIFKNENATDTWLCQIEEVYNAQGVKAAEDFIRRKSTEPVALATGLTRLARIIAPDDLDAALSLAKEATQIDPRPFRRKWLAFMYFDAGHVDISHELLNSLPESVEFKPSEKRKAERIESSYRQLHGDSEPEKQPSPDPLPDAKSRPPVDLSPLVLETGNGSLTDQDKILLDSKLKLALTHGREVFEKYLAAQCDGKAKKFRAFCYLRAAQVALDAGEEIEALRLAETVLEEDKTVTSLRGAARIFYNAARLDRAEQLVAALENALSEVKPNDRKFISEVRGRAELARWAALPKQPGTLPMQPKRVLNILAFSLPYTSVGYATRSHGLAIGIKNAGWDIRPYTRPGFPYDFKPELEGQELPAADEIDGIVYHRIFDFTRKEMSEVEYMHAAIAHYERIIRAEQPQVVHAASNYVTALPALIAARRLGVPFIYEVRGFWEITRSSREEQFKNTPKYRFMQLFEALTARQADHVITITTAMKEELIARGVPEDRISIAYNSVDPAHFVPRPRNQPLAVQLGIPESVPVIGYVGSFVDYEGLDDLIIACAGLKAEGKEFRLLLVGDGATYGDLERQVKEQGLADKTIMTGRVPHEMVDDYYSLIDIAPFPRKPWDVCELVSPLKPYEAMALEKAVVVSSTRALTEIVRHEENGLVFTKGDVSDLQAKLARLLEDEVLRVGLGKTARLWIEQERSWDLAGVTTADAYEKVASWRVSNGC